MCFILKGTLRASRNLFTSEVLSVLDIMNSKKEPIFDLVRCRSTLTFAEQEVSSEDSTQDPYASLVDDVLTPLQELILKIGTELDLNGEISVTSTDPGADGMHILVKDSCLTFCQMPEITAAGTLPEERQEN